MTSGESTPFFSNNHHTDMSNEVPSKVLLIFFLVVTLTLLQTSFIVEPGNIGLVVTLGSVTAVQSGLHFKFPFVSRVITFSAKTQKLEESNNIPTKEGLSVQLDTAM